ncbi:MAG TPA: histone deacetylase family protein [Stellaceae bacterium]|nr:histone deacetylase family protein [Stellaceae bacterium]
MTTLLLSHADCLGHEPGRMHPESPARLRAVMAALGDPRFAALERREAPLASRAAIALVHPEPYIDMVLGAVPESGAVALDPDTVLSPGSGEAALRASGAAIAAVDAVASGQAKNAFCAVRPPGHHAEPQRAMGFCMFNGVVVGAMHARAQYGAQRVAVVDFDVHHGNGTQRVAERDADLFYGSTHQYPFYPGTGAASETGLGNVANAPLPAGTDGRLLRRAFAERIMTELEEFAPDFLFVSAGFDSHIDDPLGGMRLDESDFTALTETLVEFAERRCGGRLVSILEGGYDLAALGRSAAAHVAVLMAA